ncbi:MAG: DUF1127 domain-containing protein [Alphaproteobacteria bacterium]|nr:DUF1127 domain-containing protein [Alphaproteobacteria bacterium]
MSAHFLHSHELGLTSFARGTAELVGAIRFIGRPIAAVVRWVERRRTYNELLALNPHTLSDIGLERCDVHLVSGSVAGYPSIDSRHFNR